MDTTEPGPGTLVASSRAGAAIEPARGLESEEAARRFATFGPNELRRVRPPTALAILLRQLRGLMTWLLVGAALVSGVVGEVVDAVAIGAIVVLNALVGFFQEYRAEQAMQALRAMTAPRARVLRDGRAVVRPAAEIVPGDVLLLEAGDVVAADARLLEAHALLTNEAPLTGESAPVEKRTEPPAAGAPLAERHDRVFAGTAVVAGSAAAEVFATGMGTELGKIAQLLSSAEEGATPLQQRLAKVGRTLAALCVGVVVVVAALGAVRGEPPFALLVSAVSLAVAAVPEGLTAIVTVALAVGVQRMAARHVLVRKLPAVETLGSATVVCTDKTGTLTTGRMVVRELRTTDERRLLEAATACCDAELGAGGVEGSGDPTELAILAAAAPRGLHREELERARPRVTVQPFDAERRRMSILRSDGALYVKGAVESLLPLCASGTEGIVEANAAMASRGLRVLAVAVGRGAEERELAMLGLVGIADPPRPEAIEAIAAARRAGVRTVMITGDHPVTARAIATELGLLRAGEDPSEVVHARATPEDKIRIVRGWKSRGAVVAMTGDGVNDAPALREANIGIAMGRTGTEVTREAADMILANDDFASIVAAIREGRGIFENIRKTLVYLLAGNAAELLVMLGAAMAGLPLPLLPLHLLWVNLVTDGLPALALVVDPAAPDTLERPPRPPAEPMLRRREWTTVVATGLLQAVVTLSVFAWAHEARGLAEARNLAFSVLVFGEVLRAFAARSPDRIFWEVGALSNLRLLAVVAGSLLLQLGLHHSPLAQRLFELGPLSLFDCALSLVLGLVPVTVLEVWKLVRRRLHVSPRVTT